MKLIRIAAVLIFIASSVFYAFGKQSVRKSDTIPPVIQAESDFIQVASGEESELLKGLTAYDDRDGDLTDKIIVGSVGSFREKGISTVHYLVFDSSNNVGKYERTVEFSSYQSPEFTLEKSLTYEVDGDIVLSDRLFAYDMLSGDISGQICYSSSNLDRTKCGTYDLTIEVRTKYGDEVKETVPLNVVPYDMDTERIVLSTYLIYVQKGSEIDPEQYVERVVDTVGNEITSADVVVKTEVDLNHAGSGQICYELYSGNEVVYATYLTVIVTE